MQRYMAHNDAGFGFAVGLGGASGYPSPGIPYAAVIAPDGTVAYLGHPGSISDKDVEALLKKVAKLSPEEQEARAAKMLQSAEKLVEAKELARAEAILQKVAARFGATESGRKAVARSKEIQIGDFAAEYAAQKELAKMIGGTVEKPAEADSKKMEKLAKAFEKKAAEWAAKAPKAAELANRWKDVASQSWNDAMRQK